MNDWIENAVQKIKENPQDIKVICAELWDIAYAIGAARQKTIINGNVEEYIPLRCVLEIIDKAAADYEAMQTEIDVGREKAVISFEKKDGMLAMASMIRVLVLGLRGEE